MSNPIRGVGSLATSILFTACIGMSSARAATDASPIVQVSGGTVQGTAALGVENFLDIPFAAAPVGDLRWQAPRPAPSWTGTRTATQRGTYCPQSKTLDSADIVVNEDCLHLNVQRPLGTRADAKLPVYVYLHSGGFVTGSGMKDTPEKIVRTSNVIGVSVNYRLGILGFLALPDLDDGGTFGFLDQQAALEWVKANIAAFGGDPAAVTIGGESAGGWSVCAHLASPRSCGLFARAVIQSGSCTSKPLAEVNGQGLAFARKLGCEDSSTAAACLRAKPVDALLAVQDAIAFVAHDTTALPQSSYAAAAAGTLAPGPIIVGATHDELRSFHQAAIGWSEDRYKDWVSRSFGPNADAVVKEYPLPANPSADPATLAYQMSAMDTDSGELGSGAIERGIGGCGTAALIATLAAHNPVFAYEFSPGNGPGWYTVPGYACGAGHATDLAYLYPMHDGGATAAQFTPEQSRLADTMARYWGSFTKTGQPQAAGAPPWADFATTKSPFGDVYG